MSAAGSLSDRADGCTVRALAVAATVTVITLSLLVALCGGLHRVSEAGCLGRSSECAEVQR